MNVWYQMEAVTTSAEIPLAVEFANVTTGLS